MGSELATRSLSAIILGIAVLALTLWSFESFAAMSLVGAIILAKEWWGLTKHRSRWWVLLGIAYIGAALSGLVLLRYDSARAIITLLFNVWIADISAYFIGKRFGRHKIAPSISPGKSWEGLIGSVLVCAIAGAVWIFYIDGAYSDILMTAFFAGIAGSIAVVGLLGDLFESYLKRHAGVKDSGTLIPGHGGLFDRVDALLACSIYLWLWMLIPWLMNGMQEMK